MVLQLCRIKLTTILHRLNTAEIKKGKKKNIPSFLTSRIPPPPVIWAQRKDILYITICLEDCKDPIIEIEPEKIYFKGKGGTEKKMHEVTINLYKEIDVSKTVKNLKARIFEIVLAKKEEGPYWPRLIKENTKAHWLKSDFNKWKDEEDTDEESNPPDLEEVRLRDLRN